MISGGIFPKKNAWIFAADPACNAVAPLPDGHALSPSVFHFYVDRYPWRELNE